MKTILQQKILNNLLRLAEIAKDRNHAPSNCSIDENDFWVTFYADIPEMDVDDFYECQYAARGGYEYIRRY
jgi:hypothetical protein